MTVLACDMGGSRIKLGVVRDGSVLAHACVAAESQRGLRAALPRVAAALETVSADAGIAPSDCVGIGLGFPALVDHRGARVLNAYGKYVDAPEVDLRAWADGAFGLPIAVENDARVALLGEWAYGAGRGSDDVAIITLGTGIGSAVIQNGTLLRGKHGSAGNLAGHTIVCLGGRECACGNRGCFEAETGTAYLAEHALDAPGYADSPLSRADRVDYAAVVQHAAEGDPASEWLLARATRLWGALCVNLVQAFDLDRIVIGGGVMESAGVVLPRIQEFVDQSAAPWWGGVELRAAEHPTNMALLGCEALLERVEPQSPRSR